MSHVNPLLRWCPYRIALQQAVSSCPRRPRSQEAPSRPAAASSPGSTRPPQSRRLARLPRCLAQSLCSRCSSRLAVISNLRRWGRERQGRVSAGSRSLQARRTRCPPRARAVPVLGRRPAPPRLHSWVRRVRLGGGPGGPRDPCHHLRRLPWFRLPREGSRTALRSPSSRWLAGACWGWGCREGEVEGGGGEVDGGDEPVGSSPAAA